MAKTTSSVNYVTSRRPRTGDPIVPGSVVYDVQNRPTSLEYKIGFGTTTETVSISYTAEGFPVFKGVEYRNYQFNMWNATLVPNSFETDPIITDINLSNQSVDEGDPSGTEVGIITASGGTNPFTYSLIGGNDVSKFQIGGIDSDRLELVYTAKFDDGPLDITIRATDNNGKTFDKEFSITVEAVVYASTLSTSFDGLSEYVDVGRDDSIDTASFSVSLWTKYGFGQMDLIGKTSNFWIRQLSNNLTAFFLFGDGGFDKQYRISSGILNNNAWHHVVMTYDDASDTMELYVDGAVATYNIANDQSFPTGRRITASNLNLGNAELSGIFSGNMDEVSWWDKSLNLSEVQAIYNSGSPNNLRSHPAYANLVHWWKMGENDTSPVMLDSRGSLDGDMINMDQSNFVGDVP